MALQASLDVSSDNIWNDNLSNSNFNRSPLSDISFHINSSTNARKDIIDSKYTSTTFPIAPTLQFSNLDFAFQSFTLSATVPQSSPSSASMPTSLITSGKDEEDLLPSIRTDVCQIPAFSHPNSPYVPWTSPVRQDIIRPSSPISMVSHYSRPLSRSGARAPEPYMGSKNRTLRTVAKSIHNFRRVLKRNISRFKIHVSPRKVRHTSIPSASASSGSFGAHQEICLRARSPSLDSTCSNSLEIWLASRKRAANNNDLQTENFMTLDEYDRMGSWTKLHQSNLNDCTALPCQSPLPSPHDLL